MDEEKIYVPLYNEICDLLKSGPYKFSLSNVRPVYLSLEHHSKLIMDKEIKQAEESITRKLADLEKYQTVIHNKLDTYLRGKDFSIIKQDNIQSIQNYYLWFRPGPLLCSEPPLYYIILDIFSKTLDDYIKNSGKSVNQIEESKLNELRELEKSISDIPEVAEAHKLDNQILLEAKKLEDLLKKQIK